MRVILTGGGTGGHFYPLIAVARSLRDLADSKKILNFELIYASNEPYDPKILKEEEIRFLKIPAGKIRRYFSIWNLFDPFKTFFGVIRAIFAVYFNFPDVIFAKGGYASFPALFAARLFGVPVILHETDSVPGKVTRWASKFAKRIAISFPEAAKYFPKEKTALVGNPVRREVVGGTWDEARDLFNLETGLPVVFVMGGSQGSEKINDLILDILPELLKFSQAIHQTGENNFEVSRSRAKIVLGSSPLAPRYHQKKFLDEEQYRNASRAADVIVSRAGGGSIFEIAAWGVPAILIPLPSSAQDHQRENAYAYARAGAAEVIEEQNLTSHILLDRIRRMIEDKARSEKMSASARNFSKLDGADKIAAEILALTLEHS